MADDNFNESPQYPRIKDTVMDWSLQNTKRLPLGPIGCGDMIVSLQPSMENGLRNSLICIQDIYENGQKVYAFVDSEIPALIQALQTLYDEWKAAGLK